MTGPTNEHGHHYGDFPVVNLSDKTYTDTPVINDGTPAVQPDTDRQPRVSPSRFDYPLPGPHGTLGD
jgi:hypothetical protein